jgi:hypothetical protein
MTALQTTSYMSTLKIWLKRSTLITSTSALKLLMSTVNVKNDMTLSKSALDSANEEKTIGKRYTYYVATNSKAHTTLTTNPQSRTTSLTGVKSNQLTTSESDYIGTSNSVRLPNINRLTSGMDYSDELPSELDYTDQLPSELVEGITRDRSTYVLDLEITSESESQTTAGSESGLDSTVRVYRISGYPTRYSRLVEYVTASGMASTSLNEESEMVYTHTAHVKWG